MPSFSLVLFLVVYFFHLFVSELEFDLDKALEHVPIHMEDLPPPPELVEEELERPESVFFIDLPETESPKLQHITKLRPRRKKTVTKPRKVAVSVAACINTHTHNDTHTHWHTHSVHFSFFGPFYWSHVCILFSTFFRLLLWRWSPQSLLGKWMKEWTTFLLKKSQRWASSETKTFSFCLFQMFIT